MSVRATSKAWCSYLSGSEGGMMVDNAPVLMRQCYRQAGVHPWTFARALRVIAGLPVSPQSLLEFMDWAKMNPAAIQSCNDYLTSKNPPKSLLELFDKAYRAELLKVRNHITSFIETEVLT